MSISNSTIKIQEVKEEVGLLVKSYRKKERISQETLAETLSMSRITIQNLESGKNFTESIRAF